MTKLIENLKASIFVSTLTKNLSMYSRFDAPKFGCVNGCMLFILYYRVNRIGGNRNFEIFINSIFFIEIKKANKVIETLLA
ncbi:hypothetical protein HWG17_13895 [Staphylococcus aureus]|uniref:hypothetical protein n=1 Tax=Staphylococcus aureus TaxID=1280 RepID=UPI000DA7A165|nr:hypothetical protein [Staphylococcus aureus]MBZ5404601.1 hypothetical protein [Staphylococcus aureus]MBZ5422942.1 hypothetical protein [Staphylococcus aureus]MDI0241651.1 hypothetical protein [Staphylococcus aureus]PZH66321.1 hypothetical protein C7Q66_14850 [Staphylococcus aureus]PZI22111.1 hypothetical protein C7R14_14485 [Staphylococcus aureus]